LLGAASLASKEEDGHGGKEEAKDVRGDGEGGGAVGVAVSDHGGSACNGEARVGELLSAAADLAVAVRLAVDVVAGVGGESAATEAVIVGVLGASRSEGLGDDGHENEEPEEDLGSGHCCG